MAQPDVLIRIVDDDPGMRESLCFMLQMEGWTARAYASADELLECADLAPPGCLVLDVKMPQKTGPQLHRELISRGCHLPVIFLTAFADLDTAVDSMKLGACDFLPKTCSNERLLTAIADAVERSLGTSRSQAEDLERLASLTPREMEVARLIAAGLTNNAISQRLGISVKTFNVHRGSVINKLGVTDSSGVARIFVRNAARGTDHANP